MANVSIQELTKVFPGGTTALDHVNLEVGDSEFMVLVGPSGCGKSTLLRIVAGLEEATEGTVWIGGRDVTYLSPRDRDIAMVFQSYALYPHMTVAENLGFSLKIRKVPTARAREQVTDTAHVLALDTLMNRKPVALSGGQRQRVAMGRAIVRQPAVFLMDEPLSNLDAKLRVAMRGELTRLHQRYRTTTLYVTHDQVEAMTLGDRIAVLDQGRLQQVGTPHELYRFPCNVFVAGFIGSPSMNLGRGRLIRSGDPIDDDLILVAGDLRWPVPAETLRRRPTLAGYAGREVYFGLRPHNLSLVDDRAGEPHMTVTAVTVESLGHEKNVLFLPPFHVAAPHASATSDESELTAMWTAAVRPTADLLAGGRAILSMDLTAAHFFDVDTGVAIPMTDDTDDDRRQLVTAAARGSE